MGTKKSLDLTKLFYKKSETRTRQEITDEIDSTIRTHAVILGKEEKSNKTSVWNNPTNNTRYPSEKLVKDSLDAKASITQLNAAKTELQNNLDIVESNTNGEISRIDNALGTKVDKVTGKGLSSNDFTSAEKEKLANIDQRANRIIVDNELNPQSTNPVQNAVICTEFYTKDDIIDLLNSIETGHGKLLTIYIEEETGDLIVDDDGFEYYTSQEVDDGFTVNVTKQAQPDSGYIATYVITQGGTAVGSKINIPKDYLVKSASVKSCATANNPIQGLSVGDKYIDFVINTKDNTGTDEHLYLNVKDLTDVYTADNSTLQVINNQFSIKSVPVSLISGVLPANQVTHQDISGKVNTSDIADNLVTDNASKVLSAKQGKILGATKLNISQGSNNANKYLVTDNAGDISLVNPPAIPTNVSDLTNDSGFITANHSHGNLDKDGKITAVATSVDKVVVTDSNGNVKVVSTLPAANVTQQSVQGKEDTSNKVTSWQNTPDNTHYPSEKLVKDNLDGKVDKDGSKVLSDNNFTNALKSKLENDVLTSADVSNKEDSTNKTSTWNSTTNNTRYPSEKLVKDSLDGKMSSNDYDTVALAVVFEDNTTSTYNLVYEK